MTQAEFDIEFAQISSFLEQFALRLTEDSQSALELVQETGYRALCNCDQLQGGTNFKAWVAATMRNTFISAYRKQLKAPNDQNTEFVQAYSVSSASVQNDGPCNLTRQELEAKIAELDPLYSKPFTLYYSGFHYEEIAKLMELPLSTVKNRIFTARKLLKERLRERE